MVQHELLRRSPLSPALVAHEAKRAANVQSRIADAVTAFAGSMLFVYVHIVWFAIWITVPVEKYPFGLLTMIVSLEAIFLSTFVLIGQNRQAEFQRAKADHDFFEEEAELRRNTEMTRQIHAVVTTLLRDGGARQAESQPQQPAAARTPTEAVERAKQTRPEDS